MKSWNSNFSVQIQIIAKSQYEFALEIPRNHVSRFAIFRGCSICSGNCPMHWWWYWSQKCVAVRCSVLQSKRNLIQSSVLQCVAVCYSVLQRVAVRCSALQCIALWCSALQCIALCCSQKVTSSRVVCCSALQCVGGIDQYHHQCMMVIFNIPSIYGGDVQYLWSISPLYIGGDMQYLWLISPLYIGGDIQNPINVWRWFLIFVINIDRGSSVIVKHSFVR